ncbi:MAG: hypothetical protein PVF46_09075 [Lysobacterales bacterium]|jgi:hypothetical protein
MNRILVLICAILVSPIAVENVSAQGNSDSFWNKQQASEILSRTRRVMLDPDLSALTIPERGAVARLLVAGRILNRIYEDSMHPQALTAKQTLDAAQGDAQHLRSLADLYYLFEGPIASTLDNRRVPFMPVIAEQPGKNVYPVGMTREKMDAILAARPELADRLLDLRSVVREASEGNLERDLAMLAQYPLLDGLHPGLRNYLTNLSSGRDDSPLYALPYSVRWAPEIMEVYVLLNDAAADVADDDPDFAAYLELRARDLVSDNYEAGDAAWVRGRFQRLNAQIGSYEVYGDTLYGVKSFFSLSLLVRDEAKSRELTAALKGLQSIQDALPHGAGRQVQRNIPVGVYNIIADFGQSRGANTATILPNDPAHSRKYGRIILLRYNIMTNPDLFADSQRKYRAAVATVHADDLSLDGPFYRTLWHEVGHYLGVDATTDGRHLNEALSPWGSHYEELKADLVSLFTCAQLHRDGQMGDELLRSVEASGVLRVLQSNQPRTAEQPYQTMQLMQMNYFLEHGLLRFDKDSARLHIDYDEYDEVVAAMLGEVLAIQAEGDVDKAAAFVQRYTAWQPDVHGKLASRMRDAVQYRYRMVEYKVLQ